MRNKGTNIVFPVLLTTLGIAWLLTVKNVDPRIHWLPVLGWAVLGLLTLIVGGIDKVTVVVGPFLLACSGFAVSRQLGYIDWDTVLPLLVILAGGLMLLSHLLPIPYPEWLQNPPPAEPPAKKLVLHGDRPQESQGQ